MQNAIIADSIGIIFSIAFLEIQLEFVYYLVIKQCHPFCSIFKIFESTKSGEVS